MSADVFTLIPTRTYGDGRRCANGTRCVTAGEPTQLSRYNPGSTCFCCQARARQDAKAEREPSTAELMSERRAVAA